MGGGGEGERGGEESEGGRGTGEAEGRGERGRGEGGRGEARWQDGQKTPSFPGPWPLPPVLGLGVGFGGRSPGLKSRQDAGQLCGYQRRRTS